MAGPGFSVPFDSPLMRLPMVNKNRKKIALSSDAVLKDKIIAAPPKDKITIEKVHAGEKIVPAEKVFMPPGVSFN